MTYATKVILADLHFYMQMPLFPSRGV